MIMKTIVQFCECEFVQLLTPAGSCPHHEKTQQKKGGHTLHFLLHVTSNTKVRRPRKALPSPFFSRFFPLTSSRVLRVCKHSHHLHATHQTSDQTTHRTRTPRDIPREDIQHGVARQYKKIRHPLLRSPRSCKLAPATIVHGDGQ